MRENLLQVFETPDKEEIRVVVIDGKPWFVGKDVCLYFGDTNYKRTLNKIDESDKRMVDIFDSMGRTKTATAINESGLYALLFTMQPQKGKRDRGSEVTPNLLEERIEKLHKFKKWVTTEVLPSVVRTGSYSVQQNQEDTLLLNIIKANTTDELLVAMNEYRNTIVRPLELQIEQDKPLVEFANHVSDTSDLIDIGMLAKIAKNEKIKIGRNKLFEWLRENKYLMSKRGHKNEPYQSWIEQGLFVVREYTYNTAYGEKIGTKTYITGKGQIYLIEKLRKDFD